MLFISLEEYVGRHQAEQISVTGKIAGKGRGYETEFEKIQVICCVVCAAVCIVEYVHTICMLV